MKHILLCTDGSRFSESSYNYAAWLVTRLNASLDVLYVTDIRSQTAIETDDFSGSIGLDASRELLNQLVKIEHDRAKINQQRAKLILHNAENFFTSKGINGVNFIHETGFLGDIFPNFQEKADLIILGKRGENAAFASGHLGANVERIIRSSHKPILVTSRQFQPIERILLAYDGSQSAQKMLEFLSESRAFVELELHLLTVTQKSDAQRAITDLVKISQKLRNAGFNPISQLLKGDPETIIANYVKKHDINLLLMGAYGHSRIRHLVIGSTTAQMLLKSQIPVLLFR